MFVGVILAQDVEPIEPCSAEVVRGMDEEIHARAANLALILQETSAEVSFTELYDDITIEQRAFWTSVLLMPECVEKFTKAYPMGRVLDEYSIAYGFIVAVQVAETENNDRLADRFVEQVEKHVREAQRVIRTRLPELQELLGDEHYQ